MRNTAGGANAVRDDLYVGGPSNSSTVVSCQYCKLSERACERAGGEKGRGRTTSLLSATNDPCCSKARLCVHTIVLKSPANLADITEASRLSM